METDKHIGLDAFGMKMIMVFLMLLDHLYYNLFPQTLHWAHYAARVVAPMFVFLMTEGLVHTRNQKKYIQRMLVFGGIMLLGNIILSSLLRRTITNSIIVTLGLSALFIHSLDNAVAGKRRVLWILAAVLSFCACFLFEGVYMIPLMAAIFYYLRHKKLLMCVVYVAVFGLMYGYPVIYGADLSPQFYMIAAVIPILLYNGERGINNAFSKYFFYVFYPLHIWIIFIIEQYV